MSDDLHVLDQKYINWWFRDAVRCIAEGSQSAFVAHGGERFGQHMTADGIDHHIKILGVCPFLGTFGLGGSDRDHADSACRAVHKYRGYGFKACFRIKAAWEFGYEVVKKAAQPNLMPFGNG